MTTFDKKAFLNLADSPWLGLKTIADEFERLHAEIAALKAETEKENFKMWASVNVLKHHLEVIDPKAEPWGWAVLDGDNNPFTNFGFCDRQSAIENPDVHVLWFETEEDAGILSDALNLGHVVRVNQKTLEKI